jgi:hypothetical protein
MKRYVSLLVYHYNSFSLQCSVQAYHDCSGTILAQRVQQLIADTVVPSDCTGEHTHAITRRSKPRPY